MNDIQVTDYLTWEYSHDSEIQYLDCPAPTPMNQHYPQWFKDLPFDDSEMEATVIDGKVENLLSVLDWDLKSATNTENTFQTLFEW